MREYGKIIISGAAFLIAAGLGATACANSKRDKENPTPPTEAIQTTEATTVPATMPIYDSYVPSPDGVAEKSELMLKKNKNYAGWIRINNTPVDYPFLKDPGEIQEGQPYYDNEFHNPNSFYLHKNFERDYEFAGSLFMDYRNNFGASEDMQSDNILIYGHNMMNLTMFGSFRNYYNNPTFWESAAFIELSSLYADYDYVVCGNAITSGYKESDFVYWDMEEFEDEEDFDFFIGKLKEKQAFDSGVDVDYGDKLLTMSTCYGASETNMRFILVARRLRDGEVAGDMSTIERSDEYKEKQKEKEKEKTAKEKS